jgi:uncharacterized protein
VIPDRIQKPLAITGFAFVLFLPLFLIRGVPGYDFWWWMTSNIVSITAISAWLEPSLFRPMFQDVRSGLTWKVVAGLAAAAALYGIFWIGNVLSRKLLPFAADGIGGVYDFKTQAPAWRIALLMTFVIGPGEEVFWRGCLQRAWSDRFGPWAGFLISLGVYTLVHAASGNLMLVLAAFVAGAAWGLLYLRFRSVVLNAVSHTAWDLAVFLIVPFQ